MRPSVILLLFLPFLAVPTGAPYVYNAAYYYNNFVNRVDSRCMNCLCEASTGCNPYTKCLGPFCGPYSFSFTYWDEAGRPGSDFISCATDKHCAEETVQRFMSIWAKDCNRNGVIDCDDYALLHKYGGNYCEIGYGQVSNFWTNYQQCALYTIRIPDKQKTTPAPNATGNATTPSPGSSVTRLTRPRRPTTLPPLDYEDYGDYDYGNDNSTSSSSTTPSPRGSSTTSSSTDDYDYEEGDKASTSTASTRRNGGSRRNGNGNGNGNGGDDEDDNQPKDRKKKRNGKKDQKKKKKPKDDDYDYDDEETNKKTTTKKPKSKPSDDYDDYDYDTTTTKRPTRRPAKRVDDDEDEEDSASRRRKKNGNGRRTTTKKPKAVDDYDYDEDETTTRRTTTTTAATDSDDYDDEEEKPKNRNKSKKKNGNNGNGEDEDEEEDDGRGSTQKKQVPKRPEDNGSVLTRRLGIDSSGTNLFQGAARFDVTAECLACICEASSKCNKKMGCVTFDNTEFCGPFQIDKDYWLKSGSPGSVNGRKGASDFRRCAKKKRCSEQAVRQNMQRSAIDCNGDGLIDCLDYAAVHRVGSSACAAPQLYVSNYWREFEKCFGFERK